MQLGLKSNGAISISGSLTLNIDYGFPNKSTITTPVASQVLTYDGTKWINCNSCVWCNDISRH